ncbi:hypothetical protein [Leptospira santarosai]|uniref:Lipoprotein n=1 Tax=Leptospira santarosai TaxID=28183 RepID=A0AB73M4Q4_9LEPT|nr:hypothetical protein [Leptospira santarosai]ASV11946.1 hypothetical protein B2G51_09725 [Leptospira santarosai]AVV51595.1 Uncharacterized protein XB17_03020 [Leptospira santarosai]MBW9230922.1 hypothetical protein [Leptospira santarosai]MDI7165610.1 hypothetical protein [Leptospira santarosai]MDO6382407.1 hypothetical protein [Leptospira santarosai]
MKLRTSWKFLTATILILGMANCSQTEKDGPDSTMNLLVGIISGKNLESANDFILNGRWNSFTGNGKTVDTTITIQAKIGQSGLELTDSSSFGGYSSCFNIIEFSNEQGYYISQNPENNGACFPADNSKGKYNKIFFFKNTEKENSYWSCSVAFSLSTLEAARTQTDTSVRTNPGTSGCGVAAFTRLEKK